MREVILQNPDNYYDEFLLKRCRTRWGALRYARAIQHCYLFYQWNLVIR